MGSDGPDAIPDENIIRDVEALRERLLYFAARRLGNLSDAEDVAQETMRRAIEALQAGRIQKPDSLPAFLFQTAVHICQHRFRSKGREARALGRFSATSTLESADDPLRSLISEERRGKIRRALEQLAAEDREILTLTYSDALSSSEIARRLHISEGNVRVRRHRALGRLAEILGVTRGAGREP